MASIITARGVSFELRDGRRLFNNLNFSLERRLTALVGPNGIGKSTLSKLLSGELEPGTGVIQRKSGITLFTQLQEPKPISVNDFLGAEFAGSPVKQQLLESIDREALCTNLSGGQWMRVRLAGALADHFLILDEPTNDLDREAREALLQFLRERQNGALLITHDRECLEICEEVLELSNRGLAKFGSGWRAYKEAHEKELEDLSKALETAKNKRDCAFADRLEQKARQEKRNRRGAKAATQGGMPKILIGRRKRAAQISTGKVDFATFERASSTVRDAHEALQQLKILPVMYADLIGQQIPSQRLVAEARGFNIRFHNWLYRDNLDFSWRGNVRIALKGANGSGKSTLLKALLGGSFETRGELRSGKLATLYLDQGCASLERETSIFENVRAVSVLTESEIRAGLAKFLFTKEAVFQKVRELSGGERLRAALACGFLGTIKPELLVLDEPTNNLDLGNIEFLENLAKEFRGALIVISHDEVFLKNCEVTQEFLVQPS